MTDETIRPRSTRQSSLVGVLAGVATILFLVPGADRGYDLDSGLTAGIFVATRSIWDAFDRAFLVTNHVLFSFLDHLVYSATGSRNEIVLRLLPMAMSAIGVGLLAKFLTERFGPLAGVAGAAVLATNPMFALEGSQLRGYSLVVVCTIVTTVLFLRALETDRMTTGARIAYAVVGAIGVATHLYMLVVLGIHAAMSLTSRRQFERIAVPGLAALLGLTAYVRIAPNMRAAIEVNGRSFQPTFARDLGVELLGGSVLATIVALAIIAPVAWNMRASFIIRLATAATLGSVAVIWLIGPKFLYPRFFLWLVPAVAAAVGLAVARRSLAIALVVLLVALQVHTVWPRLTTDVYPNRRAAEIFKTVKERGGVACVTDVYTAVRLVGSVPVLNSFLIHQSTKGRGVCTVDLRIGPPAPSIERDLDRLYGYSLKMNAQTPGILWSRRPIACWTSDRAPSSC